MNQKELEEMLRLHELFIQRLPGGKRLNLHNIDISGVSLRYANLSGANLSGVNLYDVDLSYANLRNVDMRGVRICETKMDETVLLEAKMSNAILYKSQLFSVNLTGAYLFGAEMNEVEMNNANLSYVDLRYSKLHNVVLSGAILLRANLQDAEMQGVNLDYTNLSGANFEGINLCKVKYNENTAFFSPCCPEKGAFIGFKKCSDNRIVELLIPEDAKRSSATTRKCRCSKANVLEITDAYDQNKKYKKALSRHDANFIYCVGKTVEVPDFNEDRWHECAPGIHFFMTRDEAVRY